MSAFDSTALNPSVPYSNLRGDEFGPGNANVLVKEGRTLFPPEPVCWNRSAGTETICCRKELYCWEIQARPRSLMDLHAK